MTAPFSTKHCGLNPAEICRLHGWGAGTFIIGEGDRGPTTLLITAIGETRILARAVECDGRPTNYSEHGSWALDYRDWREIRNAQPDRGGDGFGDTLGRPSPMADRELPYDRDVLVTVLIYHRATNTSGCHCGWAELGKSHPEHVAAVYEASVAATLFGGAA